MKHHTLPLLALTAALTAAPCIQAQTTDHSGQLNLNANQARIVTTDGKVRFYDTDQTGGIDLNKATSTVTVYPRQGNWQDTYTRTVRSVTFAKAQAPAATGTIDNHGVEITRGQGWNEAAYAEWNLLDGASTYHVYVKGDNESKYTRVDQQMVRDYGNHGRADMVGLKAGNYTMKIVPVTGGQEDNDKASTVSGLTVKSYDRSGFIQIDSTSIGAYNYDGTLKPTARVIYVTAKTAKTVSLDVITGKNQKKETFTGLQAIINAYQKGWETRPLCVRLIGQIRDTDMDYFGSKAEGLQVKGKNNTIAMNITIEGVGEDATIWGFGLLLRNAVSVELRNFAIMLCMDDAVSLDTDNRYCWIHHLDLFYGNTGGDSDQAKGDGTIDVKGNSQYITIAYNHLYDSGKSSLCGMKSETGPNYIDYHHNWFDHSDSRHPRVRTMSVHVWNNYYDGCAKYGVGATMGSSVFVERNFFRHSKYPMLISKQGTDAKGEGTFSGENGGTIKSYMNVYAETGNKSGYLPVTHQQAPRDFDCYEASTRNEQVPATYKALTSDKAYDNFDTDPDLMYRYTPAEAVDVPAIVTGHYGAGRMNKGDFQWRFDNATEDTNYAVISSLKTALKNYTTSLKGAFE